MPRSEESPDAAQLSQGDFPDDKTAVAAAAFLSHRRIAVTGVSRQPKGMGSNVVFVAATAKAAV